MVRTIMAGSAWFFSIAYSARGLCYFNKPILRQRVVYSSWASWASSRVPPVRHGTNLNVT